MTKPESRPLPGTIDVAGREFLYLELAEPQTFRDVFPTLLAGGTLPRPSSGGMLNEAATLTTPTGRVYVGVSYRGDRAGYRAKLMEWCEARHSTWAQVENGALRCSDGPVFPLDQCDVTLG